jgi:hypothetical protein
MRKHFNLAVLIGTAALLAACGGGDADPATVPDTAPDSVPATATASPEAFTRFAAGLAEDDQREPLPVADLVPPVDDTAEPAPVAR